MMRNQLQLQGVDGGFESNRGRDGDPDQVARLQGLACDFLAVRKSAHDDNVIYPIIQAPHYIKRQQTEVPTVLLRECDGLTNIGYNPPKGVEDVVAPAWRRVDIPGSACWGLIKNPFSSIGPRPAKSPRWSLNVIVTRSGWSEAGTLVAQVIPPPRTRKKQIHFMAHLCFGLKMAYHGLLAMQANLDRLALPGRNLTYSLWAAKTHPCCQYRVFKSALTGR
jgi:hypothetical protein